MKTRFLALLSCLLLLFCALPFSPAAKADAIAAPGLVGRPALLLAVFLVAGAVAVTVLILVLRKRSKNKKQEEESE